MKKMQISGQHDKDLTKPELNVFSVPYFKQYMVENLLRNTFLLLKQIPKMCQISLKLTEM